MTLLAPYKNFIFVRGPLEKMLKINGRGVLAGGHWSSYGRRRESRTSNASSATWTPSSAERRRSDALRV